MNIIGIHGGYDASALLLQGGELISSAREECLVRFKNWFGTSVLAIKAILDNAVL